MDGKGEQHMANDLKTIELTFAPGEPSEQKYRVINVASEEEASGWIDHYRAGNDVPPGKVTEIK